MGTARMTLSKSSLGVYLQCPMSYFLCYRQKLPKRTDYPRLLGSEVHRFVANLYRQHSGSRPFYYTEIGKARSAWFFGWNRALVGNKDSIRFPNSDMAEQYGVLGWVCINIYWKANIQKPKPMYVEKRLEFPVEQEGVWFVGIFDQIREATVTGIANFRPELVHDGVLSPEYDPVFIVDLKTNREDYDLVRINPKADLLEQAAYQYDLHQDLQVSAYYWLYYQHFQKMPAGFFWYHLRSGKWFYTYRTEKDFPAFLNQVRYMVSGLNAEQYPKHVSAKCKYCDYFEACSAIDEGRPLLVTKPVEGVEEAEVTGLDGGVKVNRPKQRRLKLKVERVRNPAPTQDYKPKTRPTIVLSPEEKVS